MISVYSRIATLGVKQVNFEDEIFIKVQFIINYVASQHCYRGHAILKFAWGRFTSNTTEINTAWMGCYHLDGGTAKVHPCIDKPTVY